MNTKKTKKTPEKEETLFKGHKTKKHFLNEVKEKEQEQEIRELKRLSDLHSQE